jgi:hypothetical protein
VRPDFFRSRFSQAKAEGDLVQSSAQDVGNADFATAEIFGGRELKFAFGGKIKKFHGVLGNVWVISRELELVGRFFQSVEHDAVIDGDAWETEQVHGGREVLDDGCT